MSWLRGWIEDAVSVARLARVVGLESIEVLEVWKGARASRVFVERQRARIARVLQ